MIINHVVMAMIHHCVLLGEKADGGVPLKLVTYNVDGLSEHYVMERAMAVCDLLLDRSQDRQPDVVLLQEVVPETAGVFKARFTKAGYSLSPEALPTQGYFTLAFFRKETVTITSSSRVVGKVIGFSTKWHYFGSYRLKALYGNVLL